MTGRPESWQVHTVNLIGLAERRARQKTSLRQDILETARLMFAEDGYAQVSMCRLATKIEYSPTTVYLYFRDKDDLFRAVCEQTFATLVRRLKKQRRQFEGDPLGGLRAGLREYVEFGLKHPDHYIVAFMLPSKPESLKYFEGSAGQEAFDCLRQAVAECLEAKLLQPLHPEVTAQLLWMSIHGLVSLLMAKQDFPFAARAVLVERHIDMLFDGLLP